MNMKRCEECGKELGFLAGYRHPTLGRESLLCGHCYELVEASVTKWREAVLPYIDFFNNKTPSHTVNVDFSPVFSESSQIKELSSFQKI